MQDITPPAIAQWLKQPVELVHVLLDRKGKTLSHAYVELADEEIFKAALRGAQNSVLGKGKRARGVTVTRSTQEELMRAVSRSCSIRRCIGADVPDSYSPRGRVASPARCRA
jgi:hypothetical protein